MAWHLAPSGCTAIWTSSPQMLSGTPLLNCLSVLLLIRRSFTRAPVQQVAARGTTYLHQGNRAATALALDSVFSAGAVLLTNLRRRYENICNLFFPPCVATGMQTIFKLLKTMWIYSRGVAPASWVDTTGASRCFSIRGAGTAADEELGLLLKPSAPLFTSEPPYSK